MSNEVEMNISEEQLRVRRLEAALGQRRDCDYIGQRTYVEKAEDQRKD